ncbi:hypothetical protein CKSOR_00027 [Candidatus Kinetoplastibacterium sorsogonicusi]|uniref:Acid stress protein IbaG n=1 Tax=Candidatus Kinetoplastidibacterium kentomonadis TaxID=1576550 RepID=A0A3Q8EXX1_9PROT|nr:BolA family protein [Candidatus Kinetoplastibacterium sorsogonicusi]AWD32172.1 hypothetical protein CKSOR_00027 [Candidatus Kinetoplastibacterium sorsogonicusi]
MNDNNHISENIKKIISLKFTNSSINVTNYDANVSIVIISQLFEKKSLIERHTMVYNILKHMIDSKEIHSLSLKTYTMNEYMKKSNGKIINKW